METTCLPVDLDYVMLTLLGCLAVLVLPIDIMMWLRCGSGSQVVLTLVDFRLACPYLDGACQFGPFQIF